MGGKNIIVRQAVSVLTLYVYFISTIELLIFFIVSCVCERLQRKTSLLVSLLIESVRHLLPCVLLLKISLPFLHNLVFFLEIYFFLTFFIHTS